MSKDLNKWMGIGRIGKDIELRYLPDGKAVANFSIACGDDYKDKGGNKVERTEWVNIVAFGKLADILGQYCGKGSQVYIEGKLQTRKWQDQQGQDKYTTEIVADQMQMLGGKGAGNASGQSDAGSSRREPVPQSGGGGFDDFDDDIPF